MENNNPTNPTPTETQIPPQPTAFLNTKADPTVLQQPSQTPLGPDPSPKGNKAIWIVAGLIILVVVLVGAYFYLGQTSTTEPAPSVKPSQTQTNNEDDMQKELNSINVEAEGSDFQEVDKDLQSL